MGKTPKFKYGHLKSALWVYPVSISDRRQKSETRLEKSRRFHAKCRKSGKMGKAKKNFDEVKKHTTSPEI